MSSKILNRLSGLLTLIAFFLVFSFSAAAQETQMQENKTNDQDKFSQTADELTLTLSQKVNLTEDQREEIKTALVDYQKNISEIDPNVEENQRDTKIFEVHDGIRSEIENVLDDNQMTAYNEFKDEWWRNVQTTIHPATVRENQTQDEQY
jgi:septal ring factor EnvC (AmiA/AmiB activator)